MLCSQAAEARSGSHTNSKAFRRCTVRGLATPDADHNCPRRSCRRSFATRARLIKKCRVRALQREAATAAALDNRVLLLLATV